MAVKIVARGVRLLRCARNDKGKVLRMTESEGLRMRVFKNVVRGFSLVRTTLKGHIRKFGVKYP